MCLTVTAGGLTDDKILLKGDWVGLFVELISLLEGGERGSVAESAVRTLTKPLILHEARDCGSTLPTSVGSLHTALIDS